MEQSWHSFRFNRPARYQISLHLTHLSSFYWLHFSAQRAHGWWNYRHYNCAMITEKFWQGLFGYFGLSVHTDGVFVVCLQSESGADVVYTLRFTSRRTNCPSGSNKPWTDCDYLLSQKVTARFHCGSKGDRRLWFRWNKAAKLTDLSDFLRRLSRAELQSTWHRLKWTQNKWNVC